MESDCEIVQGGEEENHNEQAVAQAPLVTQTLPESTSLKPPIISTAMLIDETRKKNTVVYNTHGGRIG